jgi:O-succinylbenzoic acid--CoA ligase
VVLTVGNLAANARSVVEHFSLKDGDAWLLSLPLYHVGGLSIFWRALLSDAHVVLPEHLDVTQAMLQLNPSHVSLVPTQLVRLLRDGVAPKSLRRCKSVVIGGAPLPAATKKCAEDEGLQVADAYGLSEMASMVLVSGNLLANRKVFLRDDGEICVGGPCLFQGYYGDFAEKPRNFPTGDLGAFDANGRLEIVGRKNNRIISGGENIQAEEIEGVCLMHPKVRNVVVVPRPHPEYGERPVAFVQMEDDVDENELRRYLSEKLAKFKIPDAFLPWPKDAPTNTLKPQRHFFSLLS